MAVGTLAGEHSKVRGLARELGFLSLTGGARVACNRQLVCRAGFCAGQGVLCACRLQIFGRARGRQRWHARELETCCLLHIRLCSWDGPPSQTP